MIFNFSKFLESRGIVDSTLDYTESILGKVMKELYKFKKSDEESISSKINILNIDKSKSRWREFPISEILLEVDFSPIGEDYGRQFTATGWCFNMDEENGSRILNDGTIFLRIKIGAMVDKKVLSNIVEMRNIKMEFESTILHELNHGYEHYKRALGKGSKRNYNIQDAFTVALDVNTENVPIEVWEYWYYNLGYNLYYSEIFEMNAFSQESLPYILKYDVEEMKNKWDNWKIVNCLIDFKADEFKESMTELIEIYMEDEDPDEVMTKMKNGLSSKLKEAMVERGEKNPSISPEKIKNMDLDSFLKFCEKRFNERGEIFRRKVLRNYTHKNEN